VFFSLNYSISGAEKQDKWEFKKENRRLDGFGFSLARFVSALTLADLGSTKSIVFFACAAGAQEASGAGLL